MKMKKIISLLLAACTIASFATVVSAAEEPTMKLVAEKISFDGEYAQYASDYDWSQYGCDTYSLKLIATGMEITTEAVASGRSTIYVGDSILGYQFDIAVDAADLTYDYDWKWGYINAIATPTGAPSATGATMVSTGTIALEPAKKVAKTIAKDDETLICEFLVTIDATKSVEFSLNDYAVFVGTFANTDNTPQSTYAFKKSEGTMTTTTATFTLPVSDDPIVPDEPKDMVVTYDNDARFDLDINDDTVADGYAWEVLVTNYDSTKTLSAKFTDAETGLPRAGKEKTEITGLAEAAETDGSIEFVALLQLSQARNVNFEIVVE